MSWQNILNSRQIATDIEVKLAKEKPFVGGISCIYLSLSNKRKPCHGAINSGPRNYKNDT